MSDVHQNSKIVRILRTETFLDSVQTGAKEFMSMSTKSIGSYWQSVSSKIVGSGLDYNEQVLLMPLIIDCEPSDRQFRQKVSEFFHSIITRIPYGDEGLALEIGLLLDNSKPITYQDEKGLVNLPINTMDYVRYRHAMRHPQVAPNQEAAKGDPLKLYFIYDPEVADKQLIATTKEHDLAMASYLTIKDNTEKVDQMLVLFGTDPRDFDGPSASAQKVATLRELANKRSADFNKFFKTDNLELRVKIKSFLQVGIFKGVGDRIYDASNNSLIAKDIEEAVKLLQSDEYSERFQMWSAAYQDIIAKPKKATNRRPVRNNA